MKIVEQTTRAQDQNHTKTESQGVTETKVEAHDPDMYNSVAKDLNTSPRRTKQNSQKYLIYNMARLANELAY